MGEINGTQRVCSGGACMLMAAATHAAATPAPPVQCWGGMRKDVRMGGLGEINGTRS